MAKATAVLPPKNDVYTGMLLLSVLSMFVGVTLLAYEANEYGWATTPAAAPTISLPTPPGGVGPTAPAPVG